MALPVNGSTHLIPAYDSFYRPRKDERLSWPSWLTCSGWLTHISGHPSAAGRTQDRESSPARYRRSTTVPRHQLSVIGLRVKPSGCASIFCEQNATDWRTRCRKFPATPLPVSAVKFSVNHFVDGPVYAHRMQIWRHPQNWEQLTSYLITTPPKKDRARVTHNINIFVTR